jgi:hypothetical protein
LEFTLTLVAIVSAAALFVAMMVFYEIGRRVGVARIASDPDGLAHGIGAVDGAVFALLGLLIAFTFSGAASRFEARRALITQEANAIGTAYLRIDLLPGDAQPELRALFRRYVDLRAVVYSDAADRAATEAKLAETAALQETIWAAAVAAGRRPDASVPATMLALPALNDMIDITTTRETATRNHPPPVIYLLLAGLSLVGSLLVGYGMSENKRQSWLHTVAFAIVLSLTVYVIVDVEFPRAGLIRVDAADQLLLDLRKSMR